MSVKRVSNFLKTSELDPRTVRWHPEAATGTCDLLLCLSALLYKYTEYVYEFSVCLLSQAMSFQYQWSMEPSHGMRL